MKRRSIMSMAATCAMAGGISLGGAIDARAEEGSETQVIYVVKATGRG